MRKYGDLIRNTEWLYQPRYPSPNSLFSLPTAIYYLLQYRSDLSNYNCKLINDRISLYFWWESLGNKDYPDFNWKLSDQDLAFIADTEDVFFLESYPAAIAYWMRGGSIEPFRDDRFLDLLLELEVTSDPNAMQLPRFFSVIWKDRVDLQQHFDITAFNGQLAILTWWDDHGHYEYPRIAWSTYQARASLLSLADSNGLQLPKFLKLIWNDRDDLQQCFDMTTFNGQLASLTWWENHGQREYPGIEWSTYQTRADLLSLADSNSIQLPKFLRLIWNDRDDLQQCFDIATFNGQLASLTWWENHGQHEYPEIAWSAYQGRADLLALVESNGSQLPRFLRLIWNDRDDLQQQFDINTPQDVSRLIEWWQEHGRNEYPLPGPISIIPVDDKQSSILMRCPAQCNDTCHSRPMGVNIVGFPQGVLGLGEDARMAAHVLELASFPRVVVNAPIAGPPKLDTSVDHLLSTDLKYGITLFCLPPTEMMRLALEGGKALIESETYKIGAWPWELPHWPAPFRKVTQFVDEIWAQSKFVQSVFSKLGETPVYRMPMAVEVPPPMQNIRGRFRLPLNSFLFYLMFDGNSWLSRKNPIAGVRAFQKAFGPSCRNVGLVIKAMNICESDPMWQAICKVASMDDRIHIISERLSRQDSVNFMASCDSYISLHRSEGFGRVIAEAMLLGQPVVVTNFSGNVDFCDPDTAFLVDGELVPLRPGDYLLHEGQYWCDPDVSLAADQLRRVIEDSQLRDRISEAGRHRISNNYSVETVVSAYLGRMSQINLG